MRKLAVWLGLLLLWPALGKAQTKLNLENQAKGPYISSAANPASAGSVRLAKTDVVCWRNNANDADLCVSLNVSDMFVFGMPLIVPTGATITSSDTGTPTLTWGTNSITSSQPFYAPTFGGTGSGAGYLMLPQGTLQTVAADSIGIMAPVTVTTKYALVMPAAGPDASKSLQCGVPDGDFRSACVWAAGGGTNALLDGSSHTDTAAGAVARGGLITGQGATPAWTLLAKGTADQCLKMDGTATDIAWGACGSGTPGGGDTAVQFNDGGSTFGGDATNFYYNKITHELGVGEAATYDFTIQANGSQSEAVDFIGPAAQPSAGLIKLDASGNITTGTAASANLAEGNKTHIASIVVFAPTTAFTNLAQHKFAAPVTISRVSCSTDTGTATIQLDERVEATPNTAGVDVMSSTLACDTDTEATTGFANATIAADVPLNMQITAVASTPGVVRVHIDYAID